MVSQAKDDTTEDDLTSSQEYHDWMERMGLGSHHVQDTANTTIALVIPKTTEQDISWLETTDTNM